MIVVRVQGGRLPYGGRADPNEVGPFLHLGSELAQLFRHGGNAIGFLHSPAGNVAQHAGAVGVKGHRCQRHGSIRDVVAIKIDGLEWPGASRDFQPIRAASHLRTHLYGGFNEADVALNRILTHAFDSESGSLAADVSRHGAKCYEVTGGRGIGLYVDIAGRSVTAAGRNDKAGPALALHFDPKASHEFERDLDIGAGNQLANDLNRNIGCTWLAGCKWKRHEQRGEKLA